MGTAAACARDRGSSLKQTVSVICGRTSSLRRNDSKSANFVRRMVLKQRSQRAINL
jgi:hypothetical protein